MSPRPIIPLAAAAAAAAATSLFSRLRHYKVVIYNLVFRTKLLSCLFFFVCSQKNRSLWPPLVFPAQPSSNHPKETKGASERCDDYAGCVCPSSPTGKSIRDLRDASFGMVVQCLSSRHVLGDWYSYSR
ncbi:uncharacterized protein CLUP02_03110 [Colletotrichum lupini]|uniref:Uncharacterized protein n=1 Tax=Colletotrichum lupini TaxID=145971 RepID=A0A9Q8SHV5_9PEZI|nr:uncharacterized protein CLUP02_03110 [Colletotrichum lupini]UQC77641.1 hypothetical protein CLUP02_03110 [Colletotrichum lupini]